MSEVAGSPPAAARVPEPADVVLRIRGLSKAFHGHLGIGRTVAVAQDPHPPTPTKT